MYLLLCFMLTFILAVLFFLASKKQNWEVDQNSSFECGFSSNFASRFSFSMHFYLIGLIFLFLDLELCFIMPLFNEMIFNLKISFSCWVFILILLYGVLKEWSEENLEWKF